MERNRQQGSLSIAELEESEGTDTADSRFENTLLYVTTRGGAPVEVQSSSSMRWDYLSTPGQFNLFPPGEFKRIRSGVGYIAALVVEIPRRWFWNPLPIDPVRTTSTSSLRLAFRDSRLARRVKALHEHKLRGEPFGTSYSESLSFAVAQHVIECCQGATAVLGHQQILSLAARARVEQYIEANLGQALGIDALAKVAGLSQSNFFRKFKAAFGETPHQYVLSKRVERAMLLTRDIPLSQLASDLGFASHAHFTQAFRERTGMTPSRFRQCAAPRVQLGACGAAVPPRISRAAISK